MALFKRGLIWHYDFQFQNARYQGSTRLTNREKARIFVAKFRSELALAAVGLPPMSHIPVGVPRERHFKTYFIFCEQSGLVKIGKSECPETRLASLQTANSGALTLIGTIDGDHEESLHSRFGAARSMRGEWFHLSDSLYEFLLDSFPSATLKREIEI